MKNTVVKLSMLCMVGMVMTGCYNEMIYTPTVGKQLVDLQQAKEAGTLSETEYQAQKAKLLTAQ